MALIVIMISFLTKSNICSGATSGWQRPYGGENNEYGNFLQKTLDGGYIIVGSTSSFGARGGQDVYVIKTDPSGNPIWQKTYGGEGHDGGISIQQTNDGGYIAACITVSSNTSEIDAYLIKLDPSGEQIWQRTFGGVEVDGVRNIQQTSDGGYILAGNTKSFGAGESDVYLIKTNSSGDLIWHNTYGGEQDDGVSSVLQTTDGGYIIAGDTRSFGANDDVYIVKTDSSGRLLWQKNYGEKDEIWAESIQSTSDGGYIILGNKMMQDPYRLYVYDIYLLKTDSYGNMTWQKTYGGEGLDLGYSIQQTLDDGYVIAGFTDSFGAGNTDVYIIKTDSSGNQLWQRTYGGEEQERGSSILQASDGGYIVLGYTDSFGAGESDIYLIHDSEDLLPTANAGPDLTETEGVEVAFNGYGSTSRASGTIISYDWNFGDGTGNDSVPNPKHVYTSPGKYYATLTVTDDKRGRGTDTMIVTIKPSYERLMQTLKAEMTTDKSEYCSDEKLVVTIANYGDTIVAGESYWIERFENGEWKRVETQDTVFILLAYYVPTNETRSFTVTLSHNTLYNGLHRVVKDVFLKGHVEVKTNLYAEFQIIGWVNFLSGWAGYLLYTVIALFIVLSAWRLSKNYRSRARMKYVH